MLLRGWRGWELVVAAVAVAAAVAAVWVTLDGDFLRYPGWLALQKADFILGPVFIGLYWVRRRPGSRFGPMLIAFGFVGALYVLQSASNSWLFSFGLLAETLIGLATRVLILAFPTGRLDRPAKVILVISILVSPLPAVVNQLLAPQTAAGASISGCRHACPLNEFAVTSNPQLAADLLDAFRFGVIFASSLTAGLLIWRFVKGTPPQRRALAIGTPIALLFLAFQITFQFLGVLDAPQSEFSDFIKWGIVGARAALWYGFLAALIAAELFASRALRRLVGQSLRRPPGRELEAMLRGPLGDPGLQLLAPDPPPHPEPGRAVRVLAGADGRPKIALVHDAQLEDDPELLQAAGEIAVLAAENAELDTAWTEAVEELRRSRARIVRAGDEERRKLERDLHDGVQQRLVSILIELGLIAEEIAEPAARAHLAGMVDGLEQALDELRDVSHGLYPAVLGNAGLAAALESLHPGGDALLALSAAGVGRHSVEIESAVYYCCSEAVQNAAKHARGVSRIAITLREDAEVLRFEVADDGDGFDPLAPHSGSGLQNLRDRVGALGGTVSVVSAPGRGTVVSGWVPLAVTPGDRPRRPDRAPSAPAPGAAGGTGAPAATRGGAPSPPSPRGSPARRPAGR